MRALAFPILASLAAGLLTLAPAAAQFRTDAYSAATAPSISAAPSFDTSPAQSIGGGASSTTGAAPAAASLSGNGGGGSWSPKSSGRDISVGLGTGARIAAPTAGLGVGPMYIQSDSPKAEVGTEVGTGIADPAAQAAGFAAFGGAPQRTGWIVCNRSGDPVLHVAINAHEGTGWQKRGWYRVVRGDCVVVQPALTSRYAFYFAHGASGSTSGKNAFCADMARPFVLRDERCPSGYQLVGFKRVEFGGGRTYTLNLR